MRITEIAFLHLVTLVLGQIHKNYLSEVTLKKDYESLRNLEVLFSTSDNSKCVSNCLDEDLYWCSKSTLTAGECCDDKNCGLDLENPICSYDIALKPLMKFICPQPIGQCGSAKVLTASIDGNPTTLRPGDDYLNRFYSGSSCSYYIEFPEGAGQNDDIRFILDLQEDVKVYAIAGSSLEITSNYADSINEGDILSVKYPYKIYLVFLADSNQNPGNWKLRYKYIDNEPIDELNGNEQNQTISDPNESSSEQNQDYLKLPTTEIITEKIYIFDEVEVEKDETVDGTSLIIIIGLSLIVLLVIICAFCCIYAIKRRNNALMRQVSVNQNQGQQEAQIAEGMPVSNIQQSCNVSNEEGTQNHGVAMPVMMNQKTRYQSDEVRQSVINLLNRPQVDKPIDEPVNEVELISRPTHQSRQENSNQIQGPANDMISQQQTSMTGFLPKL